MEACMKIGKNLSTNETIITLNQPIANDFIYKYMNKMDISQSQFPYVSLSSLQPIFSATDRSSNIQPF